MSSGKNMISIPRGVYDLLVAEAACWREASCWLWSELPKVALLVESPQVRDLIGEWIEWDRRRRDAANSHAVSAACDWRRAAAAPTYAELQRRRAQPGPTAEQARARHGGYRGGPVDWHTGRCLSSRGESA
ncbi:hypothetical protein A8924_5464 [Saccharopolyspora erythraea NRRL 2338]|uniref:Uncharacterized protein n=2 Tax=Saccharopolyspora erythraea TaxID=1836 RepID=A4FJW4_SACEN|nr:hypothetical protein [Saccharopolyspora erythraea]EQD82049.1 hypothetical protein N599_32820 [Saccharopolyspora erythraea D]PFG97977.1 hypothetical protein A8924_5464 [Saccharopolyspora erythraea NRRL 2338]QRK88102.1 hypothetical protein JQX30_25755 [Saccharopolyspora erythraea]CAM04339.1 hypothetical protein SACE_5080 [Saccharopolyspora erythraea NRRL 2338]